MRKLNKDKTIIFHGKYPYHKTVSFHRPGELEDARDIPQNKLKRIKSVGQQRLGLFSLKEVY